MKSSVIVCGLLAAHSVGAAVISHSQAIADQAFSSMAFPNRGTGVLTLTGIPAFDTGLGTLEEIRVSFSGETGAEINLFRQFFIPPSEPVSGSVNLQTQFALGGPEFGAPDGTSLGSLTVPFSLAAGTFSTSVTVGPGTVTGQRTISPGDPGFSPTALNTATLFFLQHTGVPFEVDGAYTDLGGNMEGTLTVEYEYAPVPEPAAVGGVAAAGLLAFGLWRHRGGAWSGVTPSAGEAGR